MGEVLQEIDYKKIFYYFEEISKIPRGSKNNQAISDYLVTFAKEHQLEYYQDKAQNVIIIKEASKGYEKSPAVILQGHMDMVCEKDSNSDHDFTKEGLELAIEGDCIYAKGTTLGGDDGIAVAYALAILDSDTMKHPRLEIILTTDEEVGMEGAQALDVSMLRGKYMLNLDSEKEGVLLSSCAGGMRLDGTLPLEQRTITGTAYTIRITGLKGGHSGTEINKNRMNSNLLMGRLLFDLKKTVNYSLKEMKGGLKDNAIPRESFAEIVIAEEETEELQKTIENLRETYQQELKRKEPDLCITMTLSEKGEFSVLSSTSLIKCLHMLLFAPNGVQNMSSHIEGLVETSLNLGIVQIEEKDALFTYSIRSSVNSSKQFIAEKLEFIIRFLGGQIAVRGVYPAWEYKEKSPLRTLMIKIFEEDYQKTPKIEAIHAGLECGLIADKIPGIDIVSYGPDMYDIHTPSEKLSISSSKRVFDYTVHILEAFPDFIVG